MSTFDASSRETCVVRPSRTNTPLQALTTLNETAFVEAARVLAEHILKASKDPRDRVNRLFQRVLARRPTDDELNILSDGLKHHLAYFRDHLEQARQLVSIGEMARSASVGDDELAAYTTVASLILNLDEAVTKE